MRPVGVGSPQLQTLMSSGTGLEVQGVVEDNPTRVPEELDTKVALSGQEVLARAVLVGSSLG